LITSEEILKYSEWIKNGAEIENPKIELKQQWWNLGEDLSQNEFLKDVTAMANTPGNTGYIIIGIDKNGELHDALVPIDPSKIRGIICKHIQDPMNIEVYQIIADGKSISVVEIPESLNKPHIIKVYRTSKQTINMYIPIRKGTSINAANKYDIEQMYLERNNIISVDYELDVIVANNVNFHAFNGNYTIIERRIGIPANVINKGIFVNCITDGKFVIEEPAKCEYKIKYIFINGIIKYLPDCGFLKINSNDIASGLFIFEIFRFEWDDFVKKVYENGLKFHIELTDIKENKFTSNTFLFNNLIDEDRDITKSR
jgi:hypothetical protein